MQGQQGLERSRTDARYFAQHRHEFLQRDPERWIAVYNQQVVGTAKRLLYFLQALEQRGLPRGQVCIEHVSSKADLLILPSR